MISWAPYPMRAEVNGVGTAWLLYVQPQGGMANDIWTFVPEAGGQPLHVRTDQFHFSENPTLDISTLGADPA